MSIFIQLLYFFIQIFFYFRFKTYKLFKICIFYNSLCLCQIIFFIQYFVDTSKKKYLYWRLFKNIYFCIKNHTLTEKTSFYTTPKVPIWYCNMSFLFIWLYSYAIISSSTHIIILPKYFLFFCNLKHHYFWNNVFLQKKSFAIPKSIPKDLLYSFLFIHFLNGFQPRE